MQDTISRQAAIDYFVINVGFHDEDGYPIEDTDELRKIWTEYFDGIPPAEPEKRTDKRTETHACDSISRAKAIEQMSLYGSVWMEYTDDMTKEQIAEKALRESKLALIEVVKQLPSAQPDIVRCKDCKHYQFADNCAFGFPVKRCEWTGFEDVEDNDFCSRAERRTE